MSRLLTSLMNNKGEMLSTLYGCGNLRCRKGESVISRIDTSPDNAVMSIARGYVSQRITTNKRTILVVYYYQNGDMEVADITDRKQRT